MASDVRCYHDNAKFRITIVFEMQCRADPFKVVLRPLVGGPTGREAVRGASVGRVDLSSSRELAAELIGKGRGAPDDVRSVCCVYRFDEASRSARYVIRQHPVGIALNA